MWLLDVAVYAKYKYKLIINIYKTLTSVPSLRRGRNRSRGVANGKIWLKNGKIWLKNGKKGGGLSRSWMNVLVFKY